LKSLGRPIKPIAWRAFPGSWEHKLWPIFLTRVGKYNARLNLPKGLP